MPEILIWTRLSASGIPSFVPSAYCRGLLSGHVSWTCHGTSEIAHYSFLRAIPASSAYLRRKS